MNDLGLANAAARISALLEARESRTLEFKRISAKHARVLETVCAFANDEGGLLAIGIDDIKHVKSGAQAESRLYGVEENAEAFDDLRRQVMSRFTPAVERLHWVRLPCTLRDGSCGHVVLLRVEKSGQVHTIIGDGTWTRMDASNRQMSAVEITDLSYRRGVRSAVSETVPVSLDLLETNTWKRFQNARGLKAGSFAEQLQSIHLARQIGTEVCPTRAAVLLFADEPGSLLAAHETRADVRVMVYSGKQVVPDATPNLRKAPKTIRGPLIDQIDAAVKVVLDELTQGITLAGSGFKTRHVYPERVIKEAIVNAVIHRDYRLNRDIFIRIFDDRIEVESPGVFPGNITAANIGKAGSMARNPLIAINLREFPTAPNIDAGEGVKMMFAEMSAAMLYPPQYSQDANAAVERVTVTLLNMERPTVWDEVSAWIDRHGSIANRELREISRQDTLEASRLLRAWVAQGVLVALPAASRQQARYSTPETPQEQVDSLSSALDNESELE